MRKSPRLNEFLRFAAIAGFSGWAFKGEAAKHDIGKLFESKVIFYQTSLIFDIFQDGYFKQITLLLSEQTSPTFFDPSFSQAFGPGGLGICGVRQVPGLEEVRKKLLPLAHRLATLYLGGVRLKFPFFFGGGGGTGFRFLPKIHGWKFGKWVGEISNIMIVSFHLG